MGTGKLSFLVGWYASRKLKALKKKFADASGLRKAFYAADKNGNGKLDSTEFMDLCKSLDLQLTHSELEAAMVTLDANWDGGVDYEEFKFWYQQDDNVAPAVKE